MTGLLLTGITYVDSCSKWRARAGTGEDRYHVGRYETEEEAAAALRAEQERRRGAELEDPIDHMCKLATSPGASYSSATGVYFDVRSNGPAVALTALSGDGHCCDAAVVIYACEGSGVGRETERGAWRVVGAGTLKDAPGREIKDAPGRETGGREESTRLALSPPVVVAAGATVGLFVHSAKRDSNGVQLSKRGKLGGSPGEEVDASDGAISVLKGICSTTQTPFATHVKCGGLKPVCTDGDCYALAGSVEYEMGGCEPSDSTTVCAEADANATASKTSTVNGALATLPLLRGCARRVDGPAADRHHVRESPGEVVGASRYR